MARADILYCEIRKVRKVMSSLYFLAKWVLLFEARAPEFDVVYTSTAAPVYPGKRVASLICIELLSQIGRRQLTQTRPKYNDDITSLI
jgi:hypothetical protein